MKKVLFATILFLLLLIRIGYGQSSPEGINYQAVARNSIGKPLANTPLNVRFTINDVLPAGTAVFKETHTVTTNSYGLFALVIGQGALVSTDSFSEIIWESGNKYLLVEIDTAGGTNYFSIGTTQMVSVPYALYAKRSGTSANTAATGSTGVTGSNGDIGYTGATGDVGNTGTSGSTGVTGSSGDIGSTGSTGSTGVVGATGAIGVTGTTGITGTTGEIGLTGNTGATGVLGATGSIGETGSTGITGTTGAIGLTGNTGATGDIGMTGITGADGALNAWSLLGNTGTTASSNFIGTIDNVSLRFRTNNIQRMIIDSLAHVGIGTAAPHTSALLDVSSGSQGILIPNVALSGLGDITTITGAKISLLVYNTATAGLAPNNVIPGYYYWNGTKWVSLSGGTGGNDWSLLGNAGTVAGLNFIGTTDSVALSFKVNHKNSGLIDPEGPTFFGFETGSNNTVSDITGIGYQALYSNTSGEYNTANGRNALYSNSTGSDNTAIGDYSLYYNTTGQDNTASGSSALENNSSGDQNTAHGAYALYSNTGDYNTANGAYALNLNTTGTFNTASGTSALSANTIGNENTANGAYALNFNTTGTYNTATGASALSANTTGSENTANGAYALYDNTTGIENTAMGGSALSYNTIGNNNTALGYVSLYLNSSGSNNTAIGRSALFDNTSGYDNTATGRRSLTYNTTGNNNNAYGDSALIFNLTGNNNVAFGSSAGNNNVSGSGNVFLGNHAGYNETGSNKLYIANSSTNPPLIYGNFSTGRVGINTIAPAAELEVVSTSAVMPHGIIGTEYNDSPQADSHIWIRKARGTQSVPANILSGDEIGSIKFRGYGGGFNNTFNQTEITAVSSENFSGAANGSYLAFLTTPNGSVSGIERMRIENNGYVGIGTTNPAVALDVNGRIHLNNDLIVKSGGNNRALLSYSGSTGGVLWMYDNANVQKISLNANADSYLTGGNLGIGTTAPATNARLAIKDGHFQSLQSAPPTILAVTTYVLGSQSLVNATDVAGTLKIIPTIAAGSVTVKFNKDYTTAPMVVLTATNSAAAADMPNVWVSTTTTTFTINFEAPFFTPPSPTLHTYSYIVIETH
ncbi:MAG: hypothetical protein V4608_00640 [Bacteroidota bacterium]